MNIRKLVLLCSALFSCFALNAQIVSTAIDEAELEFKVKQIDEFFERFNNEKDYQGNTIYRKNDSVPEDSILKRKNLITLLDWDVFTQGNQELDSISSEFIDYILQSGSTVHYADTTWFAEANTSVTFQNKKYQLTLWLRTEQIKDIIYKWSIFDASSPIFNIEEKRNEKLTIMPGAHGTGFMTVPDFINMNSTSVVSFFSKDYKQDNLSMLGFLVVEGQAKLGMVTEVRFHFNLGPYSFTVKKIEKKGSYNKGWLINSITRNNKEI
jgi:hypothetical protein